MLEKPQRALKDEFSWSDDLLTGDEVIDFQHKKLFEYLNILSAITKSKHPHPTALKNTINTLIEFTNLHFDDEEIVLANMGYPELLAHQEMHHTFREKALYFKLRFDKNEDITSELIIFIQDHLVVHIGQEDMKALRPTK